jgi:glycosyltransferase involved in cell wall biosynthesis
MKFSVVIPTRQRCRTLTSTLRTCVEQDLDMEILVSDNASQDATRDVVHGFRDPRIRYVNTGRRVGMSLNWDFALAHVTGDLVTYIGDDDGLLPNALRDVADLLALTKAPAIAWQKAEYCWPDHPNPDLVDWLGVPTENRLLRHPSRESLRGALNAIIGYNRLPCLYNGFVPKTALDRLRDASGRLFHSATPDVYSAFAVPSAIPWWLFSTRPFSVNGASGASNGANFLGVSSVPDRAPILLEGLEEPEFHPRMPDLGIASVWAYVAEAAFQASDHCYGGRLPVRFWKMAVLISRELAGRDPGVRAKGMARLRGVAAAQGAGALVDFLAWAIPGRPAPPQSPREGRRDGFEWVRPGRSGVVDVYGAACLAAEMLGPYRPPGGIEDYSARELASKLARILRR